MVGKARIMMETTQRARSPGQAAVGSGYIPLIELIEFPNQPEQSQATCSSN
jgi:hypothetical protein